MVEKRLNGLSPLAKSANEFIKTLALINRDRKCSLFDLKMELI